MVSRAKAANGAIIVVASKEAQVSAVALNAEKVFGRLYFIGNILHRNSNARRHSLD